MYVKGGSEHEGRDEKTEEPETLLVEYQQWRQWKVLTLPSIGCYPLEQPEEEGQVEHPERC